MKNIGTIKNPLTIIAIFAGIAEVSGTAVLPFVSDANQRIFICFLIGFPTLLIILFFMALNFNNKVLYAPSDYTDEGNFIKMFQFDSSSQNQVEFKIAEKDAIGFLSQKIDNLNSDYSNMIEKLKSEFKTLIEIGQQQGAPDKIKTIEIIEKKYFEIEIAKLDKAQELMNQLTYDGFVAKLYDSPHSDEKHINEQEGIWLGVNVPIKVAKEVLSKAKGFYPHLKYIYIPEGDKRPAQFLNHIFIGGATSAAKRFGLKTIPDEDWKKISHFTTLEELHSFIREYY